MPFIMKWPQFLASVLALVFLAGCASINRTERQVLVEHRVSPVIYDKMLHGDVLSLGDIIELSQRQVPPGLIIGYLSSTRAVYALDKPGLARLRQGNVCQQVIDYLLDTPSLFAPRPRYYYGGPWYPYGAYYPYDPYYPCFYGGSSVVIVGSRWHCR